MPALGQLLRRRRDELGIGQEALAARLGVTQQTVSRWEMGLSTPRPARLGELAQVLDLDATVLHRLAGNLPADERSEWSGAVSDLYAAMSSLTRAELLLLMDRVWYEIRTREGLRPME